MKPSLVEKRTVVARAETIARQGEHIFYTGMAVAIVIIVFAGFAPTYYLKSYFNTPPLIPLLHLHGLVFTSWLLLFFIQNVLVAAKRIDIHRRLGIVGAIIAGLMVVVGTMTAIIRAKPAENSTSESAALIFLVIPLGDILVFSILVGAGLYFRRRTDIHKRLMLLATISILAPAIARLPFALLQAGPPAFFGLTDLFIVVCLLYDLLERRRIHQATMWGGLIIVVSQPLRLMIGSTHTWLSIAHWLTQWVA
ncbi:MAG: hypothetical protein AB1489_23890 [Acidobacteriota bacterium]